jgi:nitrate reductase delta subunit
MRALKALSALLSYPSAELLAAGDEILAVFAREPALRAPHQQGLARLVASLAHGDLIDTQERWLLLFDRTRSLSLHLFEHVHGESRDRGQAMVDLIALYEAAGYQPTASELPDYLPLFLEFASTRPAEEARDLLCQPAHVLTAIAERLERRGSPYAAAFTALLALGAAEVDTTALAALRAEPDPEPDDLEALDAAWEEQEVLFGPGAAHDGCTTGTLAARLRQAQRPAPGFEFAAQPRA